MTTFGVLPTKHIRGTPAHKSSNTCVTDCGSNPHPEVVAAAYIKNGAVFSEVYLLQLCVNIQLFICGMESVRALIPVGHQTTFYLRRAERIEGVDNYDRIFARTRGYDSANKSELQEEMQGYRGFNYPERWTERQKLLHGIKGRAGPSQDTCAYEKEYKDNQFDCQLLIERERERES